MTRLKSIAVAAAIGLAATSAPGAAALVSYNFWTDVGSGLRAETNCDSAGNCNSVFTDFNISRINVTFVVDTSAGMPQYGNPDGGNGSTYLGGGSYYNLPIGVSAQLQVSGLPSFDTGLTIANHGSDVSGSSSYANFSGRASSDSVTIDSQTGDITYENFFSSMYIDMADPGPIVFTGGEWLPGMSGLALGTLSFMQQAGTNRVDSIGSQLSYLYVSYEFSGFNLRYGTGPASVPEPGALALSGLGLLLLAARLPRQRPAA